MSAIADLALGATSATPVRRIEVGADLDRIVTEALGALGDDPDIYKRAGELVRIVRVDADESRHAGTPTIRSMQPATLKVRLTRVATWFKINAKGAEVDVTPPDEVVAAIAQLGDWPGIRRLTGLVETPYMRPDGTICQTPGYDAATGYYFDPLGMAFPAVPSAPTRADACNALAELYEPFAEFPHASPAGAMVPVSNVLTMLARPAIAGDVPLFCVEANTRGSGKTKIGDTVSVIATGRPISKFTFPRDDEELEKMLGSIARQGEVLFSFDNVGADNPLGGAPLDKVLTAGGRVSLRILGKTEAPTFDWRTVVLASGNNVTFRGDTARRALVCRLESPLENPEDRDDFAHPDLLGWVSRERGRLVVAGLILLRAYVVAGRPAVNVRPWGSFEAWARLVPRAIVWASEDDAADPMLARPALDDGAEPEKTLLARVLESFPPGEWRTKELLDGRDAAGTLVSPDFLEALEEVAPRGEKNRARKIGETLQRWKGRVVGGLRLVVGRDRKAKVATWRAERV